MDDQCDELTAQIDLDGDIAVIRIDGEIDIATRHIITEATENAVAAGATRLILDMSGVTFMDSSGISALIATRRLASVTLRKPSMSVERLLATTGLTDTFRVEP